MRCSGLNSSAPYSDQPETLGLLRSDETETLALLRKAYDAEIQVAFHAIGDLLVTGPTGTNVNDFRAILVR